jgi:D-glycero-alpha-D-manno-heptose-7-phosphate kinase
MIISRTPFRISFFGGGTDYPAWYREEGGAVLSTTIDKFCYLSSRVLPGFFNIKHRIVWSHIETVSQIAEILHPAVREGLRFLDFDDRVGLEIHYQGDLPARAGMGSSSSFAVGLIKCLLALRGQMVGKRELALLAMALEQDVLKEHVGSQDQIAAAYGGLNLIRFRRDGGFTVDAVPLPAERLEALQSRLMLFFTGSSRIASEIAAQVVANLPNRRQELRRMAALVDEALAVLTGPGDLDDFGRLLNEAWRIKRGLSPSVSSPALDAIYETAMARGALGGKLLGAGGTGFMLFHVPPERRQAVIDALPMCLHVPFRFEQEGSVLIHYEPNGYAGQPPNPGGLPLPDRIQP